MIKVEDETVLMNEQQRDYHRRLRALHLAEGYSYSEDGFRPRPYWPVEPTNWVTPCHWRWQTLRSAILEACELIEVGHGKLRYDRRVIALTNPGLQDHYAVTTSLFADFQLIRPGECVPSHRHTPCATRFIFEGQGWTTVGGERVRFEAGDIVHTGQFPWHDHGNDGDGPLVFLDVLDIPLLQFLAVSKWEFDYWSVTGKRDNHSSPVGVADFPNELYTKSHLRPRFGGWRRDAKGLAHLRWLEARQTLLAMAHECGNPHDGILLEFTNTETGGPVGTTVSLFTQMLRPGEKTGEHRHTSQTIYVGVEGRGRIYVGGETFEWGPRDVFVVPSWCWHAHENLSRTEPAFLHSISDAALIAKIELFREQWKDAEGYLHDTGWQDHYFRTDVG
jgi:gentisate 1,2-dioxygenase